MGRMQVAVIGVALAVVGMALTRLSPIASVAVSFVGAVAAGMGCARFNVPLTRVGVVIGGCCHGAAVALATGVPLLGVAAGLPLAVPMAGEGLVGMGLGYRSIYLIPTMLAISGALTAVAWPGPWGFAVLPALLFTAYGTVLLLGVMKSLQQTLRPSWDLKPGEIAPDFTLNDSSGKPFTLSEHRGRYVLLMFLVGEWCPICHVRMRIYQKAAPRLAQAGVKLVAIWGSGFSVSDAFVRELGLEYTVLSDEDSRVSRLYGGVQNTSRMVSAPPILPRPSSFLVGPDGTLRLSSRADELDSFLDPDAALELVVAAAETPVPVATA